MATRRIQVEVACTTRSSEGSRPCDRLGGWPVRHSSFDGGRNTSHGGNSGRLPAVSASQSDWLPRPHHAAVVVAVLERRLLRRTLSQAELTFIRI